jgi:NADP-dependent 3-hydroxy acid dehydrogenase YdfG
MKQELSGKVAVISGASSGVGKSIAIGLAEEGAGVILLGRNSKALEEVALQCGFGATRHKIDLLNETDIVKLGDIVKSVDILVHSAGVFVEVGSASVSNFGLLHRVNVIAPIVLTQVFLPQLKAQHGHIVFINSTAALGAQVSQYAATKQVLKVLADSLREEVNSYGVRVLSIYLGRTATPMQAEIHRLEGKPYVPAQLIQPAQIAAVVVNALTLGPEAEITDMKIRPTVKPGAK